MIAFVAQIFFAIAWVAVVKVRDSGFELSDLSGNGNFFIGCALFSYPFVLGLMFMLIRLRKHNTVRDYLALHEVNWKPVLLWIGCLCVLLFLASIASGLTEQETPEFMETVTDNTNAWMMFATLIIAAPVVEEFFFRGFMFRGIAASRAGSNWAIVLTTLVWVAIHGFQYDWFPLMYLTAFGILLGWSRHQTGSVITPLILHIFNNAITITPLVTVP